MGGSWEEYYSTDEIEKEFQDYIKNYLLQPSYDELLIALKETHRLYLEAISRNNYFSHDLTRVMGNDRLFKRIESND